MLISKTVITKWNPRNKIWYETKGYIFTRWYDEIEVRIEDLFKSSNCLVEVQCDNCGKIFKITWATYQNRDNIYCKTCANKLYGSENVRLSKLKNGTSFEQWCKNNNRQDILDRWDYELNNCKPNEIGYATNKKCYFKCPNELHNSELKNINSFTNKYYKEKDIMCNQCNSFGQYLINTYGESGIIKYWSEQNIVNPFEIAKMSNSKYYIKCQEKGYHEDYAIACYNFVNGNRCPFCSHNNCKIHTLDSLGTLFPEVIPLWSDKNEKSPYNYSPHSKQKVWWKCPDGKHEDYLRNISDSTTYKFRCPKCNFSQGEERIKEYLIYNQVNYEIQKEFENLIGLKGRNLSYDFYLPIYNLLIEYQGEFHDGTAKLQSKKKFKKQQEHDKRKKEYADLHNIELFEIWYWDFENIEEILKNKFIRMEGNK